MTFAAPALVALVSEVRTPTATATPPTSPRILQVIGVPESSAVLRFVPAPMVPA